MTEKRKTLQRAGVRRRHAVSLTAAIAGIFGVAGNAAAFQFDTNEDWQVRWDNTVSYNLGFRAKSIDPGIGNNPVFSESDYKFPKSGDVVTNRIANLTEFDAVFKRNFGARLSASMWKDFAYNNENVANNPANSALGSYSSGKYSSFTRRYYKEGAQLLDAFVFANFDLNDQPSSIRVGRVTQFWGNTQFFGTQGINYSQNAADNIKALTSPGTQAKELAIPRAQILFQTQLTEKVSLAAQYFAEFEPSRNTTGGTYMGAAGFLFDGPDRLFGAVPRSEDLKPKDGFKSDFGVKLGWTPVPGGGISDFTSVNSPRRRPGRL
ncbi:DUF1302 domain-containing protein [Noviherbaspirillum sedimenti]|uniref:DUF1302 family protein n=1 Tax=Noviherbaspirillum sedimenti TaxID=2320865 RepID=A0A3A3FYY8_9BURK|nr:DUF1302 family protein [Noviherbaspirillum sedimenti]RJG01373.1 DUF1302 family protein [Noviherbaspirillum sedimenti]